MIITAQKPLKDILELLQGCKAIFIVGCAQCATVCKTGGEEEVAHMERLLRKENKTVAGKTVLDPACNLVKGKQFFLKNKEAISGCDALLVMACGNGVQTVMEAARGKKTYPALDTLFLGQLKDSGHFIQKCMLCAECIIDRTGGICPITVCTKGLLNGPCGGSKQGRCEIDRERDCGWIIIYNRLKEIGETDKMKAISKPQDYSKQLKPQRLTL